MRPVLRRPNAIDKGHCKLLVRWTVGNDNLPPIVWRLGHNWRTVRQKRLGIVEKRPALDEFSVPRDLYILAQGHCQIHNTSLNEFLHAL